MNMCKNVLTSVITIITLLAMAELFLRLYTDDAGVKYTLEKPEGQARQALCEYDGLMGWRHMAGVQVNLPIGKVSLNARGARSRNIPYRKPAGAYRIVILGDSFAFGYGLDNHETLAYRLETLLNKDENGPAYEAVNLGVSGYGTDQEYLVLLKEGVRYSPDLVLLVFFTTNDFAEADHKRAYNCGKPLLMVEPDNTLCLTNVPPPMPRSWTNKKGDLSSKSYLYRFIKSRKLKEFSWDAMTAPSSLPLPRRCSEDAVMPSKEKRVDLLLGEMKAVCESRGARLLVIVVPWYRDFVSPVARDFVFMAHALLQRNRVAYCSLWDIIQENGLDPRDLYCSDMAYHFTPAAVDLLVKIVEDYIRGRRNHNGIYASKLQDCN